MSLLAGSGVEVAVGVETEDVDEPVVDVASVVAEEEEVAVGVARHEQADETLLANPPQLLTKVGSGRPVVAVKVGQKLCTCADAPIIWRRQLSCAQFGAMVSVARFAISSSALALLLEDEAGQLSRSKATVPRILTK